MKNPFKALEAIEYLVGDDFGEDMEFYISEPKKYTQKEKDKMLLQAAKLITKIYLIAHAETKHACSHPEWEKIKYDIIKKYNSLN